MAIKAMFKGSSGRKITKTYNSKASFTRAKTALKKKAGITLKRK